MRLYNINGKLVNKNVNKYLIKWDKKSRSKLQFRIKQFLRQYWENQIVFEEFPVYGSLMKVDIINATKRIAIEVNGNQHSEFNPFFHDKSRLKYLGSITRDYQKHEWLTKNNFKIIELEESEEDKISVDFIKEKYGISII